MNDGIGFDKVIYMKKVIIFIITVIILLVALSGFFYYKKIYTFDKSAIEANEAMQKKQVTVNDAKTDGEIVEIPIEQVKGITQREAEELCYLVMGEADAETGFAFSFGVTGAVEKAGKQYYVIRASWLVDYDHISYIGDFFVSADGKEIYDGLVLSGD